MLLNHRLRKPVKRLGFGFTIIPHPKEPYQEPLKIFFCLPRENSQHNYEEPHQSKCKPTNRTEMTKREKETEKDEKGSQRHKGAYIINEVFPPKKL